KKTEDIEKVRRLIRNLQEQEQGYRGLLQNSLQMQDDAGEEGGVQAQSRSGIRMEVKEDSDDDTSVDLEVKTENSETSDNSQESRPRIESKLGMESGEEDDQRERSLLQFPDAHLGASTATTAASPMVGTNTSDNATMSRSPDLDNSLMPAALRVPMQESEEGARAPVDPESPSLQHHELLKILKEKQQQLQALMGRQEELNLKRRETEKKLLQAQARDNKARAALTAVTAGRQYVEKRLASHQAQSLLEAVNATSAAQAAATASAVSAALETGVWNSPGHEQSGDEDNNQADDNDDDEIADDDNNEDRGADGESRVLKSNIVGYPESDDEDNSNVRELGAVSSLPNDLQELRRQLNFLRNEFSLVRSALAPGSSNTQNFRPGPSNIPSRQQKQQREPLPPPPPPPPQVLQQTQQLEDQVPFHPLQANVPSSSRTSGGAGLPPNLQASMNDMAAPTSSAVDSAMATFARLAAEGSNQQQMSTSMDPVMVSEVQEKLRRLKEVRGQLDQLRSLVEYYQDQRDDLEPREPRASSQEGQTKGPRQENSEVHNSRPLQEQDHETEPPAQLEVFMHPQQQQQQHRKQQGRQAAEPGALEGAASFQNMAQLLNLAGADQVDDHSDEENASVSQSESQWSHLGPWDDDPEIQEKVKKLKAAKEKLRQLQDLVAFVQQSPDAARALPDNLGDIANSTEEGEGEAVSQATQTDEPNASVSEGEILSDSNQHRDNTDGLDSTRAELERLRKERAMLLEIQNQLKQIQEQTEGTSVNRGQEERRERQDEQNGDLTKPGQTSNAPVVTFASNDELYSKMRRQRILREELRSKKKELEAIMKKDRNKRQYSRNQDNQSDTVSLNTDTFGITASVDATMATWGGSTVDNLENITEDEDGQERNERSGREEDDEDDGYPSDGIVQVEEEEEENDSDNGTYTIEADARQRRNLRTTSTGAAGGMGIGARPKTSRGRQTYPQPSYGEKNTKKFPRKQTSKRSKGNQREYRLRQE
ncbi:pericentriolar material 1 protein, partial [Elysia marginata]